MVETRVCRLKTLVERMGEAPSSAQYRSYQKTIVCRYFERGVCAFGDECRFAHPESTNPVSPAGGPPGYCQGDTGVREGEMSRAIPLVYKIESGASFSSRAYVYTEGEEEYWETAFDDTEESLLSVSVMSYNVLADAYANEHARELYSSVPDECLCWSSRSRLLEKEISHWSPDIVCLQEVDHFKDIERLLRPHGYIGRYTPRTNGRPDGLAMFWQKSKFQLVASNDVSFAAHGLRDNVAQIYALKSTFRNPLTLVISNIHVLFNPKRGDIKVGQVRRLVDGVHGMMDSLHAPAAIMCGDFNSAPESSIYSYVLGEELDLINTDRRDVSGQVSSNVRNTPLWKRAQKPRKHWKDEEMFLATGAYGVGSMSHGLRVSSSYQEVLRDEPSFTTAHDRYIGTVDYIFYSNGTYESMMRNAGRGTYIRPLRVLALPPFQLVKGQDATPTGLLDGAWPSDHVSLLTHFSISYGDAD